MPVDRGALDAQLREIGEGERAGGSIESSVSCLTSSTPASGSWRSRRASCSTARPGYGLSPPGYAMKEDVERLEATIERLQADLERLQLQVTFLEELLRNRSEGAPVA